MGQTWLKQCELFGAAEWSGIPKTMHGRRNYLECQRIPLLACLAVCRTVSTETLQVLAGDMPWDQEASGVTIACEVKTDLTVNPEKKKKKIESIMDAKKDRHRITAYGRITKSLGRVSEWSQYLWV